ncbi:MAG: helix-turn-helix domain-containing protein [Flavobacteriaceae bacterium]|jgi:predicted DNA-binding transcriptional regulator AlpA|nr:helix-turn-helix domain-containing protein [Flavobacteriaceae bacterium]
MDDKLIITLKQSELRRMISDAIDSKISKLREVNSLLIPDKKTELLTRKEVAELFGISLVTLDKWRRFDLLPRSTKQGGRIYFLKEEIENYIKNKLNR